MTVTMTMPSHFLSLVPLLALLAWAAAEDARVRRIRNWLTLSLTLTGLANAASGGGMGLGASAVGLGAGFGLTVGLFALGAIGGGDVKLLAGVGAWVGAWGVLQVFAAEAVIGMVVVVAQAAAAGRLGVLSRNSLLLAVNLVHVSDVGLDHAKATGQSCRSVDRPLPYAVPVLAAVALLVAAGAI